MNQFPIRPLPALAALLCLAIAPAAQADGYFLQADGGRETRGGVVAIQRGALTFGANASVYDGGKELYASLAYALPLGDVAVMKFGPTIGKTWEDDPAKDDELHAGGKISLERYGATEFGGIYGLAEIGSINNAWFLLAQIDHHALNAGIGLSRAGSDNYTETTLALRKGFRDSPFSLRAGYKFDSDEAFIGFAINTF